jgi:hypothetical protein
MTEPNNALDAVAGLMRERQKFESWIDALEAKRASSPSHVFDRVRGDYERRLQDVMRQLGEHSPVLEQQARSLDDRVAALAEDERAQRDLRAEAELRSAVGELSPADWESLSRESDEALAALAEEQEKIRDELSQVRELLTAATTSPRALTPIASPTIPAPASAQPAASAAPAAKGHPTAASNEDRLVSVESLSTPEAMTPADNQQFDELEFLKSVADAVTPGAGMQTAGATAAPADMRERAVDPSLGIVVTDGNAPNALGARRAGAAAGGATPMAANVTGNQPIVLRSETAQTKTLKCSDCGAMNFPTEWYCERCGAELAAL